MKLRQVLLGLGATLALSGVAQPTVMNSDAQAFLERGRLMYESRNYVGAIDQLSHMLQLPCTTDMEEEAELLIAMSSFERGESQSLDLLITFVEEHPTSPRAQLAQEKIGNYYFYRGDWKNALLSYSLVRERALNADMDENVMYRIAYCHLRLGEWDQARTLYERLARTKRYGSATDFYNAYIDYAQGDYDTALEHFQAIPATSELGYQAQYYITQIKYHRQHYDDVIATGQQLLAEGQNDYFTAELNRMVGESHYHKGNRAKARQYLQQYIDNPDVEIYRTAAYTMGVLDYDDGKYQRAIDLMGLAIGENDALAQSAWLYLGQSKLKLGDSDGSARAFEQAASMNYDAAARETALYNYAVAQHKGARTPFGKSIDLFEEFLNDYPRSQYKDKVEGYLVDAYLTGNDYEKALASISHIKNPGSTVLKAKQYVLYNLGVQALSNGQTDLAIDRLKQAVALGERDKTVLNEARLWLAEAQYRSGNYKEATSNQMSYINAAGKDDSNYGIAQYNLGYSLFQQRRYPEAKKAFQNAINSKQLSDDLRADAYNRLGDTQYYNREFTAAQRSYDQAMKEDKNATHDYAMYQKGIMMGMNNQWPEEVAQLDAMLKQYPASPLAPQAMLEKGNAQVHMGNGEAALATFNGVAKNYPKTAEARKALLQVALVNNNLNRTDAAIEAFKRVIKTYPSSEEAQTAAEDLKLIYAERGELSKLQSFLASVPNGPRIDVSEIDRLDFEQAEKAAIADTPDISKMQAYLAKNPNGTYAARARYYIARHNYMNGNLDAALTGLDDALKGNGDASWAEDAMAMRCDILSRQGKLNEALKAYRELAEKSSSDDNRIVAEMGVMRTAMKLEKWVEVTNIATKLLTNSALTGDEEREVALDRALAARHLGDTRGAEADLKKLAADPQSEEGAQAAVELATIQFEAGNYKDAEKTINALIDAGTPHHYWLARGFLVLADCYAKQGKTSDAREYLQSLKNNYPGKEKDIIDGIDSRLKALKKK